MCKCICSRVFLLTLLFYCYISSKQSENKSYFKSWTEWSNRKRFHLPVTTDIYNLIHYCLCKMIFYLLSINQKLRSLLYCDDCAALHFKLWKLLLVSAEVKSNRRVVTVNVETVKVYKCVYFCHWDSGHRVQGALTAFTPLHFIINEAECCSVLPLWPDDVFPIAWSILILLLYLRPVTKKNQNQLYWSSVHVQENWLSMLSKYLHRNRHTDKTMTAKLNRAKNKPLTTMYRYKYI